jgi:hypothetical protein
MASASGFCGPATPVGSVGALVPACDPALDFFQDLVK